MGVVAQGEVYRMSLRFRVFFAGACATLAVLLCVLCARYAREDAERVRNEALERYGGETVSLVVAQEGLEAGDVVSSSNVTVRDWLSDLAPQDAVTSVDEVIGMSVTVPVAGGSPLTALNFREDTPMAEVPSGCVAVSVPVTERLGLAGNAAAGARVVAYRAREDSSELIADDITVLAAPASDRQSVRTGTLTLAVRPDDVSAVLSASDAGDLRVVIPADDVGDMGSVDVGAADEVEVEDAAEVGEGQG